MNSILSFYKNEWWSLIHGLLPALFFLIEDKLFLVLATSRLHKICHKIKDVKCFTISHTYDCLLYGIL